MAVMGNQSCMGSHASVVLYPMLAILLAVLPHVERRVGGGADGPRMATRPLGKVPGAVLSPI
jgi:hypothetical protein